MSDPDPFNRALELHEAGRLAEAEALCTRINAEHPRHPGPLLLLGIMRVQSGDAEAALPLLRRSLGIAPNVPIAHFWHAAALAQLGQNAEAIRSLDRAVELAPDHVEAHYSRGQLLLAAGRAMEALAAFDRILALRPDLVEAQFMRAAALSRLGRPQEAIVQCDRMLSSHPDHVPALNMRCELNGATGRFLQALADSERSLALIPDQVPALINRGSALFELRRIGEAEKDFERALELDPSAVRALMMRGVVRAEFGRLTEAVADFDRCLMVAPNDPVLHTNKGNALRLMGRHDQALECFSRALALNPRFGKAYYSRGLLMRRTGQLEQALSDCERALALEPSLARDDTERLHVTGLLCHWRDRDAMITDLASRIRHGGVVSPWIVISTLDDPELQWLAARSAAPPAAPAAANVRPGRHERLKIAYLSPDFGEHAVAYQIVELIERHDRTRCETFGFYLAEAPESAARTRIAQAFEHFDILGSRSDPEIAARLRHFEIDIAVDLAGHTLGSRPKIFALRPAPVAVAYAGYPGTTGGENIDYILADATVIPPEQDRYFSEKVVRLPECFFPSDTRIVRGEVPTRAQAGLDEGAFVFCAFNNSYKLTPQMFDIWMRLLRRVDGGVLWLSVANDTARRNLREEAHRRGVAPQRLVFAQHEDSRENHLARLPLADLFLDTVPYNAHSTASDFLWADVPVVTWLGRSFAGRVAASMLATMGLRDLVAANEGEYEQIALELAQSPGKLQDVRARLAANRATSPLFDMDRLARHIETAYETMWKRHSEGAKPEGFAVPP